MGGLKGENTKTKKGASEAQGKEERGEERNARGGGDLKRASKGNPSEKHQ